MIRHRDCKGRQHVITCGQPRPIIFDSRSAAAELRMAEKATARGQSRRTSLIETCMSTAIGYVVAVSSQIVVFPLVGIHIAAETNLEIGALMTVVSVVRGF